MTIFNVYYMRPAFFRDGVCGDKPDLETLHATHAFLRTIQADSLGEVYSQSQGEVWSPNGEARTLIRSLGLQHTSMSVGDVVRNADTGQFFVVTSRGFDPLVGVV